MKKKLFLLVFLVIILTNDIYAVDYILPTKIYGQVLAKDSPFSGLRVTAHYIDIQNKENSVETFTSNRDEARDRGNIDYVGYYFFDNIRDKYYY